MSKVFTIAEIGVNHNGSLNLAIKLIENAKKCGADAVKFQMYDTKSNYDFNKIDKKLIHWSSKLSLSFEDFKEIANYCKKINIEFISSVFDVNSLNYYLKLKPKIIKIPSSEVNNFNLLDQITKTKLITIFSNGIADLNSIRKLKKKLSKRNYHKHKFLKESVYCLYCVSKYPTEPIRMNLNLINTIKQKCKIETGLSDHTIGIEAPIIAAYLGSNIIEKHFKLDKRHKCPDQIVSLDKFEFKKMVDGIRIAEKLAKIGKIKNDVDFIKKGFYVNQTLKKNIKLKKEYLIFRKPNLSGKLELNDILGKKLKKNLKINQALKKNHLYQ